MFICHTYGAHVKELITHLKSCHIKSWAANGVLLPDWDQATAALQAIEFDRVQWMISDASTTEVISLYFLLLYGC